MKVKLKKVWEVLIMASVIMTELTGCTSKRQEYEDLACNLLEEKYGQEFQIKKYMGHEWTEDFFEAEAFSTSYPEILFELKAACDGSYISDEYIESRVCRRIEERIEEGFSGVHGYLQIKVQAVFKEVPSQNADMDIDEFMKFNLDNKFAVYLHYHPEEKDVDNFYQTLKTVIGNLEFLSGGIQLYILDEDTLKKVQEYLEDSAKIYDDHTELLKEAPQFRIPVERGAIQMEQSEFEEKAGGLL